MKRTRLRLVGISTTAESKKEIQSLLREICIKRDQGCVLRDYADTGRCSGPLQAEHLNSRSNTVSFADTRNIVCLCRTHHIFWKPQNSQRYWEIIEEVIGPTRWEYVKKVIADKKAYKVDLKLAIVALKQELKQ